MIMVIVVHCIHFFRHPPWQMKLQSEDEFVMRTTMKKLQTKLDDDDHSYY